jgi:hypothetical protein
VRNEADAINEGFRRLEAVYPELLDPNGYSHVETTEVPVNKNETKSTKIERGHCVR